MSQRICYLCKGCETGLPICRSYPRRLESLTVCRCHFRPQALVRPGFDPAASRSVVCITGALWTKRLAPRAKRLVRLTWLIKRPLCGILAWQTGAYLIELTGKRSKPNSFITHEGETKEKHQHKLQLITKVTVIMNTRGIPGKELICVGVISGYPTSMYTGSNGDRIRDSLYRLKINFSL